MPADDYRALRGIAPRIAVPRPLGLILACLTIHSFCLIGGGCRQTTLPPAEESFTSGGGSSVSQTIAERDNSSKSPHGHDDTAQKLQERLIQSPDDLDAILKLAKHDYSRGKTDAAFRLLESVPVNHPKLGVTRLALAGNWAVQQERYQVAEDNYLLWLQKQPQAVGALRPLAFLLNRQGRRIEALPLLQTLCRLGDITQDELVAMISPVDAIFDPLPQSNHETSVENASSQSAGSSSTPPSQTGDSSRRMYTPIGVGGWARHYFTQNQYRKAADLIQADKSPLAKQPAIIALEGRCLAETGDHQRFLQWHQQASERVREFPDYWAAVAAHLISVGKATDATRPLLESLSRDPYDHWCIQRLMSTLRAIGREEDGEQWTQRRSQVNTLRRAVKALNDSSTPSPELYFEVARQLLHLNRNLEAIYWQFLGAQRAGKLAEVGGMLQQSRREILSQSISFPTIKQSLLGLSREKFPMPTLTAESFAMGMPNVANEDEGSIDRSLPPAWRNVTDQIGLQHTYLTAAHPKPDGFAIYETLGGGVAVVDIDLDGTPDLFLARGNADPPSFLGEPGRRLWRSLQSSQREPELIDITLRSGVLTNSYTLGVTAGDFNSDGWPDLVEETMNGPNLWINQGDGTLRSSPLPRHPPNTVPSSVAIADVTGDSLPDLVEVLYIEDSNLHQLPERDADGKIAKSQGPRSFQHASDRILVQSPDGSLKPSWLGNGEHRAAGLGLIIGHISPTSSAEHGNEIFVGNDMQPNDWWRRDESGQWSNYAVQSGVAYSSRGEPTASMGIAAADFDGSGTLDLFIANFQGEANNLFLQKQQTWVERTFAAGLGDPSLSVLGFGAQPIDWDNDGDPDLMVANGGVERLQGDDETLWQLPQAFQNENGMFRLHPPKESSEYYHQPHIGRSIATLDFDRNGQLDYVVTHLNEPTAVLLNETIPDHAPHSTNRFVQLCLVGVQSGRDAVGAVITLTDTAQKTHRFWLTSGDGYLCRNENVVHVGMGTSDTFDLEVQWPSGSTDKLQNLRTNHRWLIVEGETSPYQQW